jgi:hypothetical protein
MSFAAAVLLEVARVEDAHVGPARQRDLDDVAPPSLSQIGLDEIGTTHVLTSVEPVDWPASPQASIYEKVGLAWD